VKSATRVGWETIGFNGGYEGLLDPVKYQKLDYREMGALLTSGGTVLGTSNRGRFAAKDWPRRAATKSRGKYSMRPNGISTRLVCAPSSAREGTAL